MERGSPQRQNKYSGVPLVLCSVAPHSPPAHLTALLLLEAAGVLCVRGSALATAAGFGQGAYFFQKCTTEVNNGV